MLSAWSTLSSNTDETYIARYRFDSDGYTLHVSDLSNVWSEVLTKHQLVEKAQREKCVIDPSDDIGQCRKLLEKLEDGILGRNDSTVDITRNKAGTKFSLEILTRLPKPLGSLTWEFKLALQPPESLKSQIIMPLVGISYAHERRADELMSLLKEKDTAISKMLDKLESSGLDIASIFPNIGKVGKRSTGDQREQIVRHIKGLGPFEENVWRRQSSDLDLTSIKLAELLDRAFASGVNANAERVDRFTDDTDSRLGSKRRQESSLVRNEGLQQQQSSSDEFQRQETPPHIRQTKDTEKNVSNGTVDNTPLESTNDKMEVEDESTDDEEQLDTTNETMKKQDDVIWRPNSSPDSIAARQIGISAEDAPENSSAPSQRSPADSPPLASASPIPTTTPSKAESRKLGTIGGRKAPDPPTGQNNDNPPRRKLGKIGGRAVLDDVGRAKISPNPESRKEELLPSSLVEDRSTAASSKDGAGLTLASEPPSLASRGPNPEHTDTTTTEDIPGEDDEDRADRRREELKRQIEEKSKVQTKRKRKF